MDINRPVERSKREMRIAKSSRVKQTMQIQGQNKQEKPRSKEVSLVSTKLIFYFGENFLNQKEMRASF